VLRRDAPVILPQVIGEESSGDRSLLVGGLLRRIAAPSSLIRADELSRQGDIGREVPLFRKS
jgi:hypothetical protein